MLRISVWLPTGRLEGICLSTWAIWWQRWSQEFCFSGESLVFAEHRKHPNKTSKVGILTGWNILSSLFAQWCNFVALVHDQQDVMHIHLWRSDTSLLDTRKKTCKKRSNLMCTEELAIPKRNLQRVKHDLTQNHKGWRALPVYSIIPGSQTGSCCAQCFVTCRGGQHREQNWTYPLISKIFWGVTNIWDTLFGDKSAPR